MRRISVIIPSYNHARFLPKTLPSVLDQDYPNLELVIVDDGSSDGSPELIEKLIAGAPSGKVVFIRQSNAGAHAAIMRGIAAASGEILTILNSDDYYEPNRLSELMRHVPEQGDFMVFSLVHFVDMNGNRLEPGAGHLVWYERALREASVCPTVGYGLLRNNFSLTSGNLVFTRTLYDAAGGFSHYKLCHDWDFLMKTLLYVEPIFVQKPLMNYRVHDSNTTLSVVQLQEEEGISAYSSYFSMVKDRLPANHLAPCRDHWPVYFDYFIDTYAPWFSPQPIRLAVGMEPAPAKPEWSAWKEAIADGRDCGYLTQPVPGQAALAIVRELSMAGVLLDRLGELLHTSPGPVALAHTRLEPAKSEPAPISPPPGFLDRLVARLVRGKPLSDERR